MSRSTQFIGLTRDAEEYVKNLEPMESDTNALGMFEEIPLRKWKIPEQFKYSQERPNACLREVVQASPWSSGPMIFTCLEADFGNGAKSKFLEWISDPRVEDEVDQKNGKFWV